MAVITSDFKHTDKDDCIFGEKLEAQAQNIDPNPKEDSAKLKRNSKCIVNSESGKKLNHIGQIFWEKSWA